MIAIARLQCAYIFDSSNVRMLNMHSEYVRNSIAILHVFSAISRSFLKSIPKLSHEASICYTFYYYTFDIRVSVILKELLRRQVIDVPSFRVYIENKTFTLLLSKVIAPSRKKKMFEPSRH